jgi:death-on-curing protein
LAQPPATFDGEYLHKDIFEMGAAYLFHIVQNHPFIDGNKRTGLSACLYFLALNSIEIEVDPNELERFVRSIANGEVSKPEIAYFLRKNSISVPLLALHS